MCIRLSHTSLILLTLLTGCSSTVELESKRLNILLKFSDDQRMNNLSCFGSEISTPNIDSIVADGMKFNSWYVAFSICTPSRFSLMAGK
ncbi:MAG: sulfatase-like hydrolase/transferase [Lentisphaerales bacterium]|nr:sulfatase-like hydrolase/transferase [Lentisphaerales bacterium]